MRAGGMFYSSKTAEAGSWKFCFGENKIIPDHNNVHNNSKNITENGLFHNIRLTLIYPPQLGNKNNNFYFSRLTSVIEKGGACRTPPHPTPDDQLSPPSLLNPSDNDRPLIIHNPANKANRLVVELETGACAKQGQDNADLPHPIRNYRLGPVILHDKDGQ